MGLGSLGWRRSLRRVWSVSSSFWEVVCRERTVMEPVNFRMEYGEASLAAIQRQGKMMPNVENFRNRYGYGPH